MSAHREYTPHHKHSDEVRIGACADYLLGKSYLEIEGRWGVPISTVLNWIRKTGHFKLRNKRKAVNSD
jgi:transposase